jgi:hypothetical protein
MFDVRTERVPVKAAAYRVRTIQKKYCERCGTIFSLDQTISRCVIGDLGVVFGEVYGGE